MNWEREKGLVFSEEMIRLDLFRDALRKVGDPQKRFRVILVAGTKGKGSTSLLISRVLHAHGFRTGLFTSPHLVSIRERIRVGNRSISRADFATAIEHLRENFPYFEETGRSRTFFESLTAAAFLHFAWNYVDVAVLEVGLGGRLDATNVTDPEVSVITPISRDHLHVLGSNLIDIATEKAGVIRPERPLVLGRQRPRILSFFRERAAASGTPVVAFGTDFHARFLDVDRKGTSLDYSNGSMEMKNLRLGLLGEHQAWNCATALAAVSAFGVPVFEGRIRSAIRTAHWPGRGEFLRADPPVFLDGAHNSHSAEMLARLVKNLFPGKRPVMIFAGSRGKEFDKMFKRLLPAVSAIILTQHSHPRGIPADELKRVFRRVDGCRRVRVIHDPREALAHALRIRGDRPLLITGSLYLVGELRTAFRSVLAEQNCA